MTWDSTTLKDEAGAGSIITWCSRQWLTSSFSCSTFAPKKTFGVTWEQILRAIQPLAGEGERLLQLLREHI